MAQAKTGVAPRARANHTRKSSRPTGKQTKDHSGHPTGAGPCLGIVPAAARPAHEKSDCADQAPGTRPGDFVSSGGGAPTLLVEDSSDEGPVGIGRPPDRVDADVAEFAEQFFRNEPAPQARAPNSAQRRREWQRQRIAKSREDREAKRMERYAANRSASTCSSAASSTAASTNVLRPQVAALDAVPPQEGPAPQEPDAGPEVRAQARRVQQAAGARAFRIDLYEGRFDPLEAVGFSTWTFVGASVCIGFATAGRRWVAGLSRALRLFKSSVGLAAEFFGLRHLANPAVFYGRAIDVRPVRLDDPLPERGAPGLRAPGEVVGRRPAEWLSGTVLDPLDYDRLLAAHAYHAKGCEAPTAQRVRTVYQVTEVDETHGWNSDSDLLSVQAGDHRPDAMRTQDLKYDARPITFAETTQVLAPWPYTSSGREEWVDMPFVRHGRTIRSAVHNASWTLFQHMRGMYRVAPLTASPGALLERISREAGAFYKANLDTLQELVPGTVVLATASALRTRELTARSCAVFPAAPPAQ